MAPPSKQQSRPPSTGHVDVGLWIVAGLLACSAVVWTAAHLIGFVRGRPVRLGFADAGQLLAIWTLQLTQAGPGPDTPLLAASSSATLPASDGAVQVVAGVMVAVLVAVALLAWSRLRSLRWPGRRQSSRQDDAARWGTAKDLRSILTKPGQAGGRLVLGTFGRLQVAVEELHSVFVMGPTQSFKTSSLAIPVLLEWEGAAVVTSVKPDLLEATRLARWREGEVWVFDPAGVLGTDGAVWDPLAGVTSWAKARELARWLTEASAETKELGDATKGFFEQRGERPLAAAIWAAVLAGHHIGQVRRWIDALGEQAPGDPRDQTTAARYNDSAEDILAVLAGHEQEDAILALKSVMDEDPRQRSGTLTSAQAALDVFADDHVEAACTPGQLTGGQVDPERLLDGSNTLYLFAPLHEQERLRPIMEALVQAVVRTAMERTARTRQPLDVRLLVLLDEAGNIAPVRTLAQVASTGAGQGIQLVTIFQDGAQVRHRYGRQAATVINNHRAKLILSGLSDQDSLELVSRLIGDSAEVEESTTTGEDRRSQTEHVAYRRLAPPSLLRSIRPGEGVLLYGHLPACKLRLRWWIKDKDLAQRAGPAEERRSVDGQHPGGRPGGDRRVVDLASRRRWRRAS